MSKTTPQFRQFQIQQSDLNKALQICGRALDTNNILPINSMFLFDLRANELSISACNMSQSVSTSLMLMGNELEFKIAIPGAKLKDYVAKCKPELLMFTINEHVTPPTETTEQSISYSVTIASSSNPKNNCNMPCEPGDDFPVIKNTPTAEFELPAEDFLEALYKTMFAISDDQLRPSMGGLYVQIQDGKIIYTSTNANVLASYSYDVANLPECKIIIPKKSLQLIQSLNPTGTMKISIGEAISVDVNGISTRSRLIDERYPDYLAVLPTENTIDFVTSRTELISSLKRIISFSNHVHLIKLDISETGIILTAANVDFAEQACESISGALVGSPIIIGGSGELLLGLLNSFTEDQTWFSLSKPNGGIIITDGDKHINPSKENLSLIMPMYL